MLKILLDPHRPAGRFFYCLLAVLLAVLLAHAVGPALTTISDTVYRADGSPASGTLVISWPAFTTADSKPVAAGELKLTIGALGALNVKLAPNAGSYPSGTFYKVVYKLSDGTTATEYWVVPVASSATVAGIRASIAPAQTAAQFVSKQYVDGAVSTNDTLVLHKSGSEAVSGVKAFSVSPTTPTPTIGPAVANKDYVDTSVTSAVTLVTGAFVSKSGDTMTGPLNLFSDPVTLSQAANRHYVDLSFSTATAGLFQKLDRTSDTPTVLAGVRYAPSFQNIQAAITDAGTSGAVMIPPNYAGTDSYTNPNNINIIDMRGKPDREKGFINALTDCGLRGDGVFNDGPALATCLAANPGKHFIFPKTQPIGNCDYNMGSTNLTPYGAGTILEGIGSGNAGGLNNSELCWNTEGVNGITITANSPQSCNGCMIKNLSVLGPSVWFGSVGTNNVPPCNPSSVQNYSAGTVCVNAGDGIQVQANFTTLDNVFSGQWGRHGVNLDATTGGNTALGCPGGTCSGFSDNFNIINTTSRYNRGDGFYCKGGDCNAGSMLQAHAYNNQAWGFDEQGF